MSIERQRRVTFVDDISPITADILNDLQAVTFDTFSNLHLKVESNKLKLARYDALESGHEGSPSAVVVAGKIRFADTASTAVKDGISPEAYTSTKPRHAVVMDVGNDTGAYTNSDLHTIDFVSTPTSPTQRAIARYTTDADGNFENTEMVAGAVARSRQYNAFTFKSIDDNSTPLTIEGINGDKPNLVVDAEVTFKPHDDPEYAAEGHIMVDTAKGGIKTELIVAPDSTDPLSPDDPTLVIGYNVHVPGDITVDGDLIFDTHELGTIGASRWDDLLSANETLPWELADCTFEHLLPNPSHAPLNHYPIGSIQEIASSHNFDADDITTWPTGWLLLDDTLIFNLDDDVTAAWLTPLVQYLEGPSATVSGDWSFPAGSGGISPGTGFHPFIFLGPMSYLIYNSTTDSLEINPEMQEFAYDFTNIDFRR